MIASTMRSSFTSPVFQWLMGGGLVALVGVIFYLGVTIGRVNQTLQDLAIRVDKAEVAIRDVEARAFGMAPRGQRQRGAGR